MKHAMASFDIRQALHQGLAIPAHPLALDENRRLDERRQRALSRYYLAAGAGGLAVAVHTTQFAIREAGLLEPVLTLAAEEVVRIPRPVAKITGICGPTSQALKEAALARHLGYHAGLLSLGALREASEEQLVEHCQAVAEAIPVIGFYLQPSVGGRTLPLSFWRRFVEIENVVAIKIAPFNRYQTQDVVRAVLEAGRDDIALYTGNDDNIVGDLVTPFRLGGKERRIQGGLLGHWSVWTRKAVELLDRCQKEGASPDILALGTEITDCNAAFFDAANGFRGCIAGLHEVLKRQGLLKGLWCLEEHETLSPGQREEIARVQAAYPHLNDDAFVAEHLDDWLK
ncbi:MAG TPA: dihydrodipicolinate synthase family protein [Prosthecobacter sp.]